MYKNSSYHVDVAKSALANDIFSREISCGLSYNTKANCMSFWKLIILVRTFPSFFGIVKERNTKENNVFIQLSFYLITII